MYSIVKSASERVAQHESPASWSPGDITASIVGTTIAWEVARKGPQEFPPAVASETGRSATAPGPVAVTPCMPVSAAAAAALSFVDHGSSEAAAALEAISATEAAT
ncbi:hypothetical protein MRX96_016897 [Rhipicephalus microplus]